MPRQFARRTDGNQARIVRELRRIGVRVKVTSGAGMGMTDLVCFYRGAVYVAEVKNGKGKTLTEDQVQFHDEALAGGVLIPIWETETDALRFFGVR